MGQGGGVGLRGGRDSDGSSIRPKDILRREVCGRLIPVRQHVQITVGTGLDLFGMEVEDHPVFATFPRVSAKAQRK